jgi:amino acid transporter
MVACAAMILAATAIVNPTYVPQYWHTFLLTCLLLIMNAVIASCHTRLLARINQIGTIINVVSLIFFYIFVPIESINTSNTSEVWETLANSTEWPDGFAIVLSFLGVVWTMSGYDASFHLSEECSNANVAAPRAIMLTSGLGALLGWFLILIIGYTVKDVAEVIRSDLGQPMASYLLQVLGQKPGLLVLSFVIVCSYFSGQGCMIVSSRVIYALSRDGVLPGSQIWSKVHPWTRTPVYAGIPRVHGL